MDIKSVMGTVSDLNTKDLNSKLGEKNLMVNFLMRNVLLPVRAGIIGFTVIFTILILKQFYMFITVSPHKFRMDISDILLSVVGFICLFLIDFLKNRNY